MHHSNPRPRPARAQLDVWMHLCLASKMAVERDVERQEPDSPHNQEYQESAVIGWGSCLTLQLQMQGIGIAENANPPRPDSVYAMWVLCVVNLHSTRLKGGGQPPIHHHHPTRHASMYCLALPSSGTMGTENDRSLLGGSLDGWIEMMRISGVVFCCFWLRWLAVVLLL